MADSGSIPAVPERQEQRGRPRFKIDGAVVRVGKPGMLSSLGLGLKEETIVNLSRSGVLALGPVKLEPKTRIKLRVEVPKWDDRIECEGEVRWCGQNARSEKLFYLGIRFIGLSPADEKRIGQMHELTRSAEYQAKAGARKDASSPRHPKAPV
jgi:hypothetical protein